MSISEKAFTEKYMYFISYVQYFTLIQVTITCKNIKFKVKR